MTLQKLLDEITSNMNQIFNELDLPQVSFSVEPAKPGFGDITCNASFLLAKHLKKKPNEIAVELLDKYQNKLSENVVKSEPHPSGYLNFFVNWANLSKNIICESLKEDYGFVNIGKNSRIVVEHTSVNPNKALHIGHVRNIVIGDTIARILKKANYDVQILNYIDDSGLQVADIILGFKHLGFSETPPNDQKFDRYCGDVVYVKTTEKYASEPQLEEIRKKILQELEEGSTEIAKFGDSITKKVLAAQLETCWRLSIYYDCLNFESQIIRSGLWQNIFEKLKEMNMIHFENEGKNQGCWVIPAEEKEKEEDKVLVRSNGTATYIAKDIPYAAWKLGLVDDPFYYKKYEKQQPHNHTLWQTILEENSDPKQDFTGNKVITVIDSRQSRLQKIVTSLMAKFKSIPDAYVHLGYESVTLSSDTAKSLGVETQGKHAQMSGRKGLYVNADSVLDLLENKSLDETKKRNPDFDSDTFKKISNDVSVGTLRYEMIKQDLDKIITFDLTKSLSLEGDTAPYIQYTYARASRILEKADSPPNFDASYYLLENKQERDLIRIIGLFDIRVKDAANNLSPKVIAKYCHDLAVAFNAFYEHSKVLGIDDKNLENSRLCLVHSFKITLKNALNLLGINAPEKM